MRKRIRPFRTRKMNKKLTLLLVEELKHSPTPPMDKLNEDARWLEKTIWERRRMSK